MKDIIGRSGRKTFNCNGKLVYIDRPMVMGILNVTPDSFYDGGNYLTESAILERCEKILEEGAAIVDIGAVSTRPGALVVSEDEERNRLESALKPIRKRFPDILVSIDTYRSGISRDMVNDYGVDFINDISGGLFDPEMFATVGRLRVPYILMHIQGTPETMQDDPDYHSLIPEMIQYFSEKIQHLRQYGVTDIIIDPGFGFGKTIAHNYEILNRMKQLDIFGLPLLVGVSRKSMIYKLLGNGPDHALNGTTAVNTLALMQGADILRVHDVKEAVECVRIVEKYCHPESS